MFFCFYNPLFCVKSFNTCLWLTFIFAVTSLLNVFHQQNIFAVWIEKFVLSILKIKKKQPNFIKFTTIKYLIEYTYLHKERL